MSDIYDVKVETLAGETRALGDYRDKVLLFVNTASKCGFTPQYAGLEALHKKYNERGLVVLGFPCNQFGAQEPGTGDEIGEFCQINYGVTFQMHAKVDVNGGDAHPVFQLLKEKAPGLLGSKAIKWNFTKFLVNRSGTEFTRYASNKPPRDLESAIERLL